SEPLTTVEEWRKKSFEFSRESDDLLIPESIRCSVSHYQGIRFSTHSKCIGRYGFREIKLCSNRQCRGAISPISFLRYNSFS
ncbi:hypothetical protein PMAYCL1PPCAC_13945, partial [Pristionchus mayeri]